jgi:hypothetical protein
LIASGASYISKLTETEKLHNYKNIDFVNEKYDLLILKSDDIMGVGLLVEVGFSFFFKGIFFHFTR